MVLINFIFIPDPSQTVFVPFKVYSRTMTTEINKMRQMIEDAVKELICIFLHKAQEQLTLQSCQSTDSTRKGTLILCAVFLLDNLFFF